MIKGGGKLSCDLFLFLLTAELILLRRETGTRRWESEKMTFSHESAITVAHYLFFASKAQQRLLSEETCTEQRSWDGRRCRVLAIMWKTFQCLILRIENIIMFDRESVIQRLLAWNDEIASQYLSLKSCSWLVASLCEKAGKRADVVGLNSVRKLTGTRREVREEECIRTLQRMSLCVCWQYTGYMEHDRMLCQWLMEVCILMQHQLQEWGQERFFLSSFWCFRETEWKVFFLFWLLASFPHASEVARLLSSSTFLLQDDASQAWLF